MVRYSTENTTQIHYQTSHHRIGRFTVVVTTVAATVDIVIVVVIVVVLVVVRLRSSG